MSILSPLVSLVLCLVLIPSVRKLSFHYGLLKQPRQDRWHRKPTPSFGGLAIFLGFWGGVIFFLVNSRDELTIQQWSILLASGMVFLLGLLDDFHPLSPSIKLFGQLAAATAIIFFGDFSIQFFPWPVANILLTYFWLVGITNAINLLDNMDGLAGGVSLIAAIFLGIFFFRVGDVFSLFIALCLVGVILGFLVFNLPPARIFMGDSGSLFLGFTLASLAIARRSQASNVMAVLGVPTLLFLLPILDTVLVTITRVLRGQSPGQGGTDHTSHRLISFGLSERQALAVMYTVAIVAGLCSTALEALDYDLSLVLIPLVLISLVLLTAYLSRLQVTSPVTTVQQGLVRLVADIALKRQLFEILLDLPLIATAYYLAYWIRYGLDMTPLSMELYLLSWPVALVSAYVSFFFFGVYRGLWRYVSSLDLIRFFLASVATAVASGLVCLGFLKSHSFTLDVFLLFGVFLFLGVSGSRLSFVILDRLYYRRQVRMDGERVLLYGAGDSGDFTLRYINSHPALGYHPVGFIDEDSTLWHRSIQGVEILGGPDQIELFLSENSINGIIFTSNSMLEDENVQTVLSCCRKYGIWMRVFHLDLESIE
jgi:UDP-GlcNAc:undecaprenyl-phosphate GlcNAc-1-phosphate transferase